MAIYKPKGPTSHDMIIQVRKITGIKKVGHAGTLDSLAEGVLVLAIGRENTKKLHLFVRGDKEYICLISLGKKSLTGDEEGPLESVSNKNPSLFEIKKILSEFKGKTMQVPHKFSAVKIGGKRAYELARKGKNIEIEPKEILIKEIEILKYEYPLLLLRVLSGPGAYMRSLANDIGSRLNTGAYLKSLKRTKVGRFSEKDALTLDEFERLYKLKMQKP